MAHDSGLDDDTLAGGYPDDEHDFSHTPDPFADGKRATRAIDWLAGDPVINLLYCDRAMLEPGAEPKDTLEIIEAGMALAEREKPAA